MFDPIGQPGREKQRRLADGGLVQRFGALIESDLALRLGRNWIEFKLPFPPLSDDPWEHYLVCEAVLERYLTDEAEKAQERQAWQDAQKQSREALEAYKRERG